MLARPRSIRALLPLLALLALAVGMRLSGLFYGLLSLFHQHDHTGVVLLGLRFGTGDLNPHDFAWPWDPDVLRSFVYEVLRFITARIARLWTGKQGFATAYFSDPT